MESQWPSENFLVGDADREQAVAALKQHFQAGRITAEELSGRIGNALNSRTTSDLDRAMIGLPWMPAGRPVTPNMPGYRRHAGPFPGKQRGLGIGAFVLGALGFLCGITALPGVVLGVVALVIDTDRNEKAFAVGGIVMGLIWITLGLMAMT